jgi:hypothetical protein
MLVGYCVFGSPDAGLLVSLLPRLVCVGGERRLSTLVELVREESRQKRPTREVVLARLLEVLLIEALRSTAGKLRGARVIAPEVPSSRPASRPDKQDSAWT